jgi:SOS-response transcriptional repressor LexA
MSDIVKQRIQERMDAQKTNANVVSKAAGMDRSVLRKYMRGDIKELRDSNIRSLARVLKCSPAYLRGETDVIQDLDRSASNFFTRPKSLDVKIIAVVEPGAFRPLQWFANKELGYIENGLDPHFLHTKQFGLKVVGDGMNLAGITEGDDLVVVNPKDAEVDPGDGDFVIVSTVHRSTETQELTCRELVLRDNHWELIARSTDKSLKPIIVPRPQDPDADVEIHIVGIVCSVIRRRNLKRSAKSAMRGVQAPLLKFGKSLIPQDSDEKSKDKVKRALQMVVGAVFAFTLGVAPCYACTVDLKDSSAEREHLVGEVGIQTRRQAWEAMEGAQAELTLNLETGRHLERVARV